MAAAFRVVAAASAAVAPESPLGGWGGCGGAVLRVDSGAVADAGCAISAVAFKVNLPLALLVTLYTNPFTIVPLYLLAYQIGCLTIGEQRLPGAPGFDPPISSAGRKACSSGCWLSPSRSVLVCFCWPAGAGRGRLFRHAGGVASLN